MPVPAHYEFASDNTAGICPEAWAALEQANTDAAVAYGDDRWTRRASELVRELFETDCEVFFVFNGTAANALALAQTCRPFHSILCHEHAHIETDECGAPEFFSGGAKLILTRGALGKLDLSEIDAAILRQRQLHSSKPQALSLTQATELGTVYTRNEIAAIAEFVQRHKLKLHMDGARFANAVAALGCSPKAITWEVGIDVLSFGGTKNGVAVGDLVIFFDKNLAHEFDYRAKQAGQLASKMRFLAAPWVGLLENDIWLHNALNANAMAARLERELNGLQGIEIAFPREANAVFLRMSRLQADALHTRSWHFFKFIEPDIYRVMCSWSVTARAVDRFLSEVADLPTK